MSTFPTLLTQFGAYGDPGRDPRMNVVTVAYLAVLRDVGDVAAGTDAAHAALVPASRILEERIELAFDHLRILRDAIERVRVELEVSGIATAFVGTTFTIAELRAVYEAIWGVQLDAANFRRSLVSEDGWVIPTGRTARPGPSGGRPAELYRAGRAWKHRASIQRNPTRGSERDESSRARPVRASRGATCRRRRAARAGRGRGAGPGPRRDGHPRRRHGCPQRRVPVHACLHRHSPSETDELRVGVRRPRRGGGRRGERLPGRRRGVRRRARCERGVRDRAGKRRPRAQAERAHLRGRSGPSGRLVARPELPATGRAAQGEARPRVRGRRLGRDGRGPAPRRPLRGPR